ASNPEGPRSPAPSGKAGPRSSMWRRPNCSRHTRSKHEKVKISVQHNIYTGLVLTTQPSFEMETRAIFGRLLSRLMAFDVKHLAFDVKHDDLLASGRCRRSLRSVEES